MRTPTLLLALSLSLAAVAFLPGTDASALCTFKSPECNGWVCVDTDGNAYWSNTECVSKGDIDQCQYQSDCCRSVSFWCPETE